MKKINAEQIRKLRDKTGAPVMRVKKVLEKFNGDEGKAEKVLMKEGFEKAAKRSDRATSQGVIETYVHHSKKTASMVELFCETDFVARNELFQELAHSLALQIASMGAKDVKDLEKQDFIKNPKKKIKDLVKEVIAKTGENIKIGRIYRMQLGQ
ncbi:translation elongation factor Ts [Patescibacteria group bacterium]|nr:translation elongation factor Ts [Patescibacteria group bacterium]